MSEKQLAEGWVSLANARKEHYFVNGIALCGRWMYFGALFERYDAALSESLRASGVLCAGCAKKLKLAAFAV